MAEQRRNPSWRTADVHSSAGASGSGTKSSRAGRFVILAVFLAIIGVAVGLLIFLRSPQRPIFLSIAVTEYASRSLPANPWAREDGDALRDLFKGDSVQAYQSQERDLVLRELAQLADRTATSAEKNRPVIVHLCAFAAVRHKGVHLLVGYSQPDSDSSWLPLAKVFEVLRRCSGRSLVLLDIARPCADARLGFLSDDVAAATQTELKKMESDGQLPMLVITSASADEVSHVSTLLKRSVFGYFVEQGLRGYADGWDSGKSRDGQVNALELFGFVRTQVAEWSARQRVSVQTPALFGAGKDFTLVTPKTKAEPMSVGETTDAYPDWLIKAWLARESWLADESWRNCPRAFRHLEGSLLRAEQRWLAGADVDSIQSELSKDITDLEQHRRKSLPSLPTPWSLPVAVGSPRGDDPNVRILLAPLTDRLQNKTPLMPGELDALWQKAFDKPLTPRQSDLVASHLFGTIADLPDPSREQLKACADLIGKLQPRPNYAELHLLRLLVDLEPAQWQRLLEIPGNIHAILQSGQLAERLAAADARCLPWVQSDLAAANSLRRDGLLQLTIGESNDRKAGREKLDDANRRYQALAASTQAIQLGLARLEEAYRILPAISTELGRRLPDADEMQLWSSTIQATERLAGLLMIPAMPQTPAVKELESLAQDIGVQLDALNGRYHFASLDRQLRRVNTITGPTPNDLLAQLRSPLWMGAQRARLTAAALKIERDVAETALPRLQQMAPATQPAANHERNKDAPAWRAKLAIDLLKLSNGVETVAFSTDLALAQGSPSAEAWQDLGAKLRHVLAIGLLQRFKEAKSIESQERIGWFLNTDDLGALAIVANEPFPREPVVLSRARQRAKWWLWLGDERYVKDALLFQKITTRPELAAYGKAMNDIGRELQSRGP